MKLVVFGGTGRTGRAVLKLGAQDEDLQITAFVRTPSKIPIDVRSKLNIVVGDVLQEEDVSRAIEGMEGVISCLGTGTHLGETTLVSKGNVNIIKGMRKHGVKKIVIVNVAFLLPEKRWIPFYLKKVTADHRRTYEDLRQVEDIDWALCTAPRIAELPNRRNYKTAINKHPKGPFAVGTNDLADWLISCVRDDHMMKDLAHKMVGISSELTVIDKLTLTAFRKYLLIIIGLACFGLVYNVANKLF